ncbi:hypothetical protein [Shewanella sp. FJAT-52072]|uniref:hypothetical protein n=1 Tax=Shewanella zhangzhouensis TaxID=2864213 RepID=UPI001C6561E1|nr:hypothetical protein K0H63_09665 [Shewanella zhangzhouensis]
MDKAIPDRNTIMNFRYMLEQHTLGSTMYRSDDMGSLVDATIIQALSSTKSNENSQD